MHPSFLSSCNFPFSNVGVNPAWSSSVPVHPGDPDWHLTPRTASKGEHEMGRATGVHTDHSLPSTTGSIRRHVPWGSAGALNQRNELTDTYGEKKHKAWIRNRPSLWCSNTCVNCDSSESHRSDAGLCFLSIFCFTLWRAKCQLPLCSSAGLKHLMGPWRLPPLGDTEHYFIVCSTSILCLPIL